VREPAIGFVPYSPLGHGFLTGTIRSPRISPTTTGARTTRASPKAASFTARDRATVDAFYSAAIAAGATDNGAPGVRPELHENYYAAFVHDASGNNIEAVCHVPG